MNTKKGLIILAGLFLFMLITTACAGLPKEQITLLLNQANEDFRQANSLPAGTEQVGKLYESAILIYEKIISQGRIENAKLYYNLANAYFLKGDIGRAVVNYRRAAKLDSSDENVQKNLSFARSRRIDKVNVQTEKRVLQTLFFWHYDFSIKTKFLLSCIFFAIVCISLTVKTLLCRSTTATATAVICGILTVCFASSAALEASKQANTVCGVITAQEVFARQGDGQNYPPSFKDPLHCGTEFDLVEQRPGWLHIKLSDNSDGWIPETTADLI